MLPTGDVQADVVEGFEVGEVGVEERGFEARDSLEAPLEVDEFFGEGGLDGVPGGEVAGHALGEGLIFGGIFAGQEDGLRRESVLEGVLRGGGFALLGFGTGG